MKSLFRGQSTPPLEAAGHPHPSLEMQIKVPRASYKNFIGTKPINSRIYNVP